MVVAITGSAKISLPSKEQDNTTEASPQATMIDFTPPFQRISFVGKLKEELGEQFPDNFNDYGMYA